MNNKGYFPHGVEAFMPPEHDVSIYWGLMRTLTVEVLNYELVWTTNETGSFFLY